MNGHFRQQTTNRVLQNIRILGTNATVREFYVVEERTQRAISNVGANQLKVVQEALLSTATTKTDDETVLCFY